MLITFHKPYGVLCQSTADQPGQRTLAEFGLSPEVWPIGRLDMESEGLLLLSDEEHLVDRLMKPRPKQPKTCHAQVEGCPPPQALHRLVNGSLEIKGHRCRRAEAERLDPQPNPPPRDPPNSSQGEHA